MKYLEANSPASLQEQLRAVDISVPPRGDKSNKRTTEHVERWQICQFLGAFAHSKFVRYPLSVEKRERPDYLMTSRSLEIGIEATSAVSQDYAKLVAMTNAREEFHIVDSSLFRPGIELRTTEELKEILTTEQKGHGWPGDSVERDWAVVISSVVHMKDESTKKIGYTFFNETWLLIYDDWQLPQLNSDRGLELLVTELASRWENMSFKRIFIERRGKFFHIDQSQYEIHSMSDLWDWGKID